MPLLHQLNPDEWQIVLWDEDRPTTASWIKENIKDAEGALVLLTEKINEELLEIGEFNLQLFEFPYRFPSWTEFTNRIHYVGWI